MQEDLVSYLWQNQLFTSPLITSDGEVVTVQQPGWLNEDAGPDFSNARIRIGQTTWAGNIELHVNASDWYNHGHDSDDAYESVILHVVVNNDAQIKRRSGEAVPTVSIRNCYNHKLEERYRQFLQSRNWIACGGQVKWVKPIIVSNWLERLAIERFEQRAERIHAYLHETKYNWEQVYFQLLCRSFGFKVNADPFEMLGKQVPLNVIQRNSKSLQDIEAILFGQAGFLEKKIYSSYHEKLRLAYQGVRSKYRLIPLQEHIWKFMRLRPSNFPTVRIAQLASLLWKNKHLLRPVLEADSMDNIRVLYNVKASDYWITHYHFDKAQKRAVKEKRLGKTAVDLIMINTVIPFLFVYGKFLNKSVFQEKALDWLMQLPAEKNSISNKYLELGYPLEHAMHSQALIQMRNNYCSKKRCLKCNIGHALLQ